MSYPSSHRIKSLDKFKDDLIRVKFSDVSYSLLASGFFTKAEFSEIVVLPSKEQIRSLIKLLENKIQTEATSKQDELWECWLRALFVDYPSLAFNIALECDRRGTKERNSGRIRKQDIGEPTNFRHIVSGSGHESAELNLADFQGDEYTRALSEPILESHRESYVSQENS